MQAIILAAGMGKRLKNLTRNNPKCMIRVNGETLIERMLDQLDQKKLARIIMVVGYMSQKLIDYVNTLHIKTPIVFVDNPDYYKTNNIYSLALVKNHLCEDDSILLESDLIFENSVLDELLNDSRESLALVDKYECWMDGTCVKLTDNDDISEFVPANKFKYEDMLSYYKTVNIYKFSKHFSITHYIPFLDAYSKALGNNEYYEQVLMGITMLESPEICAKRLNGQVWYEIDDVQDLDIAESLFASYHDRVGLISSRYGGYWRYPKLLNFSDPINPYFPPQRMFDEIKANLERVVSSYPSGARVNSLLAAKNLGIEEKYCAVSNGIEELIKSITTIQPKDDAVGIIRPINEEYIQRLANCKCIEYELSDNVSNDFVIDDIIKFYKKNQVKMLIMSNPNTHTGEYFEISKIRNLLKWALDENVKVLMDESYIDFVNTERGSLIDDDIYVEYPNLIVLRNLSTAQGLFGLRIGCAVSVNETEILKIRKDLTIWNINSVAEFYLQIFEKYKNIYIQSLKQTCISRDKMIGKLREINRIHPLKSSTNFITCKIDCSEHDLNEFLAELMRYNILVKNVSNRLLNKGNYIRIAVRKEEDNIILIDAMKKILGCRNTENRIVEKKCKISNESIRDFFEERTKKSLPHRYNYVIYQDSNPSLALERDRYEKDKFLPLMNIQNNSNVLDIGCGVGRWADEIIQHLDSGKYTGIDFSDNLLEIAKEQFANFDNCHFFHGKFQDIYEVLGKNNINPEKSFDVILVNGVLMYINDEDIESCIRATANMIKNNGCVYIKESVGIDKRFTLKDFYSTELSHTYNAIYRSIAEYNELFKKFLGADKFKLVSNGFTWNTEQQNRTETSSYYWVFKRLSERK